MNNMNAIGLQELTSNEIKSTNGGVILFHYKDLIEAYNYVYTQFKKGVDDGYNGR